MAKKKNSKKNQKKKDFLQKQDLIQEIFMVCVLALGFLLAVSIYTHQAGYIGKVISNVMIGCFGFSAYLLPPVTILYSLLILIKKWSPNWKTGVLGILLIFCSVLVHVFHPPIVEGSFFQQVVSYYQMGSWNTGGVIGALIGQGLLKIIGIYGTYIILFTGSIVCLILLTERSLFQIFMALWEKIWNRIKEKTQRLVNLSTHLFEMEEGEEEDNVDQWLEQPIQIHDHLGPPVSSSMKEEEEITINTKQLEGQEPSMGLSTQDKEVPKSQIQSQESQEKPKKEVLEETEPMVISQRQETSAYEFPPLDLLQKPTLNVQGKGTAQIRKNAKKLEETLQSFGVQAKVIQVNRGPTVTRYELQPNQGVKVSKIVNLADDIALNLAAAGIRIEAPIPGKAAVGIEVPNEETQAVFLREVLESEDFAKFPSKLAFALGKDIAGNTIVTDIGKMPHLLIAGATGSGKSVCINTLITSIIYKANPNEVKLLMIDPKVVELSVYNGIPHLLIPVVTDPKKAAGALNWAVQEMIQRYQLFAEHNVRDIKGYNQMKQEQQEEDIMPQMVIVIDELADLMMAAPKDVEDAICRLAQMARAAGIHLIIATQRPSVDVITGVIKANIPSRLAFAVSSGTDSRTILDMNGAEKLLGKGDMLFYPVGAPKPIRIQGAFVSDKEVEQIVEFVKQDQPLEYHEEMVEEITGGSTIENSEEEVDEYLSDAIALVIDKERASISMLQRTFRIGFNRASRIMESMEERGIVGPDEGSKPRRVLISPIEWENMNKEGQVS